MSESDGERGRTGVAGRPRSAAVDRVIAETALNLLGERGPAGVTIEGVAHHSGVAKTTIYRRYRNRRELLRASLRFVVDAPQPPATLPTADRLVMLLEQFRQGLEEVVGLRAVATLLLETDDPEFADAFRQYALAPRLRLLQQVFQDGVARGELRSDVDYERVGDMLIGSYFARCAIEGRVGGDWSRSVVALILPSIALRSM